MPKKKSVIFLHGYLSSSESFAYQVPYFLREFDVHAIDLTGFGKNKYMPYPYTLNDYVKEVKDYIQKNKLQKPDIVAHSFGARIAIKLCYFYPELVGKLVITGGAGLKPKRSIKYRLKTLLFKFLKIFIKKEKLTGFYSKDYNLLNDTMKKSFCSIVNEHLDYLLPKINKETLLVFGEKDKETPLYMAKKFHKNLKYSKLTVIEKAGHFCFIDRPFKFNTEVREFLLSDELCSR